MFACSQNCRLTRGLTYPPACPLASAWLAAQFLVNHWSHTCLPDMMGFPGILVSQIACQLTDERVGKDRGEESADDLVAQVRPNSARLAVGMLIKRQSRLECRLLACLTCLVAMTAPRNPRTSQQHESADQTWWC